METGIKEQVMEEIVAMAQKYEIEKVILFGSRARGIIIGQVISI